MKEQRLHAWAASLRATEEAENSQREWSAEYMTRWAATPQRGSLGRIPLIVLTRAQGGFKDAANMSADRLEQERLRAQQRALADLSLDGTQRLVDAGHNLHLETPETVADAIRDVVRKARARRPSTAERARFHD